MKKNLLPLLALGALFAASCTSNTETHNTTINADTAIVDPAMTTTRVKRTVTRTVITQLNEKTRYVDLRTGKKINVRKNDMGFYTSDAGELDLYYDPTTRDTFYMGEAYPVNGHLVRGADNTYTLDRSWFDTQYPDAYNPAIDEMAMPDGAISPDGAALPVTGEPEKMRTESDGDMKMKNSDPNVKEKLKVDGEGDDMKYKLKNKQTGEKVKVTEDQVKVRDANGNKTVIEKDGDVKRK